jgi:hypothetical protein
MTTGLLYLTSFILEYYLPTPAAIGVGLLPSLSGQQDTPIYITLLILSVAIYIVCNVF